MVICPVRRLDCRCWRCRIRPARSQIKIRANRLRCEKARAQVTAARFESPKTGIGLRFLDAVSEATVGHSAPRPVRAKPRPGRPGGEAGRTCFGMSAASQEDERGSDETRSAHAIAQK
jgi:hypothetical protein